MSAYLKGVGEVKKGDNSMIDKSKYVPKYGVRIFKMSERILLIKQTIKSGSRPNDEYVIDKHKERHVDITDDSAIADAIRDGIAGMLTTGKQ